MSGFVSPAQTAFFFSEREGIQHLCINNSYQVAINHNLSCCYERHADLSAIEDGALNTPRGQVLHNRRT